MTLPALPLTMAFATLSIAAHGASEAVPAFSAKASDGKIYRGRMLTGGKPVLLMFFSAGCPHNEIGIRDMNRLLSVVGAQLRIMGMTNLDAAQTTRFADKYRAKFPILSDPTGSTIAKFGARAGLDTALILPDRRIDRLWSGYSQSTLRQLQSELAKHGKCNLKFSVVRFPAARQSGCAFGASMN